MIPSVPPHGATGSEVDIFRLLERLDVEDAIAFTSLNLSRHEYKKWGEIDFVVLAPEGLLALEVKGGQVSCDKRGIWRYEVCGKPPIEKSESPMTQVCSAYFSLRDRHLYSAVGRRLLDAAPSGFGVILARTSLSDASARGLIGGTEMPSELVATEESLASPAALAEMLSRMYSYWRSSHKSVPRKWTVAEVNAIAAAMRPWFDRVVPLSLSAARIREEQLSLTEEQYAFLDFSEQSDRLLCTGGAGCGKTLLAVECLRREMHRNPILVTGTNSLAAHLRASLVPDKSRIVSFQELLAGRGRAMGSYDSLIVDEGQQLTNGPAMEALSGVLTGGLDAGRWRWFSDPNNQVLRSSGFDTSCHEQLERQGFRGVLSRNCRNTPQIAGAVETVTGATVGSQNSRGQGPDVIFPMDAGRQGQIAAAARTIRQWLSDPEVAPGDIVLLSPGPIDGSSIAEVARLSGSKFVHWSPGWSWSPNHRLALAAATVEEFRGLEAPFVVLCDIDGKGDEPVRQLYLGMTRANFGLFVMADHDVIACAVTSAALARVRP